MLEINITEKIDKDRWNSLVQSIPEGNIFQTTYWADYLAHERDLKPIFFIAKDNNEYKGVLLFWIEALTGCTRPYSRLLRKLEYVSKKVNLAYGYWFYGPLIFDSVNQGRILDAIVSEIDKVAKKEKLVSVRNLAQPTLYKQIPLNNDIEKTYFFQGFKPEAKATLHIDLTKDLDTLWRGLKKYTRKDVTSCLKDNIKVEFLQEEELDDYKRLMIENMHRVGAELPPYYPNKNMWEALRAEEKCLEVMVAKKDGDILGAVGILEFNGIIFQIASCQSNYSYYKKINVNDLMTWEIIKWGVNNKKRIYDLTGVPVAPKTKKEIGLRNFKMKWSNNFTTFNAYEKIYRRGTKKAIDLFKKWI